MTHTKPKRRSPRSNEQELDSTYLLKLVMYLIIGSQWLRLYGGETGQVPIPIGFIIGLLFASHDHFQIDRKIEYALLLVAMFIGFWLPIGIDIVVSN
jgi:ethanolamine transporter EutH